MAGSGKTALMQRLNSHLHMAKIPGYILNLDPAVLEVPYGANIDIRDTVHAPSKLATLLTIQGLIECPWMRNDPKSHA